jgi:pimeloyl-ACP methyl ester carboxylesterase
MPLDDDMKRAMPVLWEFDARPWLQELRIPALVLAGNADPVVPVHRVRQVHQALAGST